MWLRLNCSSMIRIFKRSHLQVSGSSSLSSCATSERACVRVRVCACKYTKHEMSMDVDSNAREGNEEGRGANHRGFDAAHKVHFSAPVVACKRRVTKHKNAMSNVHILQKLPHAAHHTSNVTSLTSHVTQHTSHATRHSHTSHKTNPHLWPSI